MPGLAARTGLLASAVVVLGCASGSVGAPPALRGYELLLEARDTLSDALARALQARGAAVRRVVRGGSGPTAAVLHFRFRPALPDSSQWLYVRLVDTRSGVVLGEAAVRLDSLPSDAPARAAAAAAAVWPGRAARVSTGPCRPS